ncbi:tRNA sulfurtransferase [Candidatus Blochmanniella vafra str. BVAF]|uniref:tRNA sulfurtransferase n=1 Tax=Blochmanniella vafra (strain BVAF) TaxID=859654 RepID=E8Q622_BLOVB|nr:tRNA uracil 4-sulfurtransferase ThiI [Candidatus Blochmannia vafer]ADV33638.1 tRNA sulfurtransferase [Candidatus Blochmannia vafer str. BVAF]
MKIIIKFSPEIIIKSRSVRVFFINVLVKNIKKVLKQYNTLALLRVHWDNIEIQSECGSYLEISKILVNVPGIHSVLWVHDSIINSLEDIYNQVIRTKYYTQLLGKTFCVRVKRRGNHIVTSQDVERYIGSRLHESINDTSVNLVNPEVTIYLNIRDSFLFIVLERFKGLGGFPVGTQQESLSLISGGFDSTVASYMLIRRGCKVHYCFFNLIGNITHTIEVYKIISYLWNKFSGSHKVKLISVDFSIVVKELFMKIKNNYIGIILKRMMIRAASTLASHYKIKSLVTGESLGQVSSQTLDNLILINNVVSSSDCIVFRPLIVHDKESIIKLARQIGTEELSRTIPEYCGLISKRSCAKAKKKAIELEEGNFNFSILDKAISQAHIINVNNILQYIEDIRAIKIETQTELNSQDIIVDIRSEYEQQRNPINIPLDIKIKKIPFYKLKDQFPKLDQNKIYLLYCDQGIMSRLQAIHLLQQGFHNVKVYRSNLLLVNTKINR